MQPGVYIQQRMTYPEVDAPARCNFAFDEMLYEDSHQQGESLLTQLQIGMMSQFQHDYMHLICLGVVRKIIMLLISGPLAVCVSSNVKRQI